MQCVNFLQVAAEKLRYAVGSVLAEGDKRADEAVVKTFTDAGFKVFSFPAANDVVHTTFPFRGILSVLIGAHRVYPVLSDYLNVSHFSFHRSIYNSSRRNLFKDK